MIKLKEKVTLFNVISSLLVQICTIISGFIIPKIILNYFGSEVNGLISSITQFLSYISLIEGGVTGVVTASLYKPLIKKDKKKLGSIINVTNKFYKRISFIFIAYSLALAVFYPIIFKTNFSYSYVFTLVLILSMSLFIQYMFSLTMRTLLNADKKVYIVSIVQIVIIILNVILSIVAVLILPNIHILKLINGLLYLIQPLIYSRYVKNHYDIDYKNEIDDNLLKNRWNGFAINLASFIHFSTDITILTIFTDLSTVSIYSVYGLVTTGLRSIITSISNGISPTIGQALAIGDEKLLKEKLSIYEYIMFVIIYYLFTIAGLLITPFVMIYTKGINDANYYQPLFGILLLISDALYLIKFPHLNLSYAANKFKEITIPAYVEAILNIVISILLVKKFGLVGIVIGTIIGMIYRMIFHVYFTKKIIKSYRQREFYFKLIIFSVSTVIGIGICYFFVSTISFDITSWIIHGFIYSLIFLFIYIIVTLLFFKNEFNYLKKYIKK